MKRQTFGGLLAVSLMFTATLFAQGTAFTYQGRLADGGAAASGVYDFRFSVFADASGGSPVSSILASNAVPVSNGLFTITLEFGPGIITGPSRFLQIEVKTNASASPHVVLSPRQPLTASPYAIFSGTAATVTSNAIGNAQLQGDAINATNIAAGQVVNSLNGLRDAVTLSAGVNTTITPVGNTLTIASPTDWHLTGNAGTTPGTHFIGNTDNQPLDFRVGNLRAFRLQSPTLGAPIVIGGSSANTVASDVSGGTIAGGFNNVLQASAFESTIGGGAFNVVQPGANQSTIAGGAFNTVGNGSRYGTVSGGSNNLVSAPFGMIGGGAANLINPDSSYGVIAGGKFNVVSFADYASIGGGYENVVSGSFATIAGGSNNIATGYGSFIGGGEDNDANGTNSTVGGGFINHADGAYSTVGGGNANNAFGYASFVGGGFGNAASDTVSAVGGGVGNQARAYASAVGGGQANYANADSSVIGGGRANSVDGSYATVGGGEQNRIRPLSPYVTIGGGGNNVATNEYTTIAGGGWNKVSGQRATIGGGWSNVVSGDSSVIGGGFSNKVDTFAATIAGGSRNHVQSEAQWGFIGGGFGNAIDNDSTVVAGGSRNTNAGLSGVIGGGNDNYIHDSGISGVISGGSGNVIQSLYDYAVIPGGQGNEVRGSYSFAAGRRAKAFHSGAFVWADDTAADFTSTAPKQFAVRANSGVMIQSTNTALDLRGGGTIRVTGAGIGTGTPAFIHRAAATNTSAHVTTIYHPHCDGDPNAILTVTQNWNPGGIGGTYNNHVIGVYYTGGRWRIFNQDFVDMPTNAAFNVLVLKP